MQITTATRYEELLDKKTGRIWIDVTVDGSTHSYVHVSGPKHDAKEYHEGQIDFNELYRRWSVKPAH